MRSKVSLVLFQKYNQLLIPAHGLHGRKGGVSVLRMLGIFFFGLLGSWLKIRKEGKSGCERDWGLALVLGGLGQREEGCLCTGGDQFSPNFTQN